MGRKGSEPPNLLSACTPPLSFFLLPFPYWALVDVSFPWRGGYPGGIYIAVQSARRAYRAKGPYSYSSYSAPQPSTGQSSIRTAPAQSAYTQSAYSCGEGRSGIDAGLAPLIESKCAVLARVGYHAYQLATVYGGNIYRVAEIKVVAQFGN